MPANIAEMIGQREIDAAELRQEYRSLWTLLRRLKANELSLDDILLKEEPNGLLTWEILPEAVERPHGHQGTNSRLSKALDR